MNTESDYEHSTQPFITVAECCELVGKSRRTIERWIAQGRVSVEYRQVPTSAGNTTKTAYIDPSSLPEPLSLPADHDSGGDASEDEAADGRAVAVAIAANLEESVALIAAAPLGERANLVKHAASRHGCSLRTVYRRLKRAEKKLASQGQRRDAGRPRIPTAAYELVVRGLVSNPAESSARIVHRTLLRAAPSVMRYERNGRQQTVSVRTVQRIKQQLLEDPQTALMFLNGDEIKEFSRVWAGEVYAEHANDLWEIDMTRCDIMVVDPETGRIYRPRIHAIIDVYSGCIPGLVFSEAEDQAQTDLAILRAISPKDGRLGHKWPVWGIPKRLYVDNGKTYTSPHAHRILNGLGVEVIHSKPRVSHTRGKIERFFGSLHSLEKTLPGYTGPNAIRRSSEDMKRLEKATMKWLQTGGQLRWDSGRRLLTIDEYQTIALRWLMVDYHEDLVDGITRVEHFTSTAPPNSLLRVPFDELQLLFAKREERVVDPAGRVKFKNRWWTIPDGSLVLHQGRRVLVMRDELALETDRLLIAWQDRLGKLEVIGLAEPAATISASLEADDQRRASRAAALEALRQAKAQKKELTDPELRVPTQLLKQFDVTMPAELPATARGRLEAVNPPSPEEEIEADDVLGQAILRLQRPAPSDSSDPLEVVRYYNQRSAKGDKQ